MRHTGLLAATLAATLGATLTVATALLVTPLASADTPADNPSPAPVPADQLIITVSGSTVTGHDGQFTLSCNPLGGNHPDAANACAKLATLGQSGADPFAGTPANTMCTQIYGGAATATITGSWQGHAVNTAFNRKNGCEMDRWNKMVPILPPESPSSP